MLERLILPSLGDTKLVTLTPAKVRQWHSELGADHPTRNARAYALLHAICTTAVQDDVLDANPCRIRAAMQTKRKRDIDILTPAEALGDGRRAIIIDLDHNGAEATVYRLLALGAPADRLRDPAVFRYCEPEDRIELRQVIVDSIQWRPAAVDPG